MSDGNFNKALLPHTPFYNGLSIGRKQGLQTALQAFEEYLRDSNPALTEDEIEVEKRKFNGYLAR